MLSLNCTHPGCKGVFHLDDEGVGAVITTNAAHEGPGRITCPHCNATSYLYTTVNGLSLCIRATQPARDTYRGMPIKAFESVQEIIAYIDTTNLGLVGFIVDLNQAERLEDVCDVYFAADACQWFKREKDRAVARLVNARCLYPLPALMKPAQQKAVTETQQKVIDGLNGTLRSLIEAEKSMNMNVPGYSELKERSYNLRKQIEQLRDTYGQPSVDKPAVFHIVWNDAKTEGFVTTDGQLAYEVRKGSESNCYDRDGCRSELGIQMIHVWGDDTCSIETVVRVPEEKLPFPREAQGMILYFAEDKGDPSRWVDWPKWIPAVAQQWPDFWAAFNAYDQKETKKTVARFNNALKRQLALFKAEENLEDENGND